MTALFAVAALAAAAMGFAIQRGATCTVAAVAEVLDRRRANRLIALVETALWVAAGVLAARALGVATALPPSFPVTAATVAGGVLLGLGAVVNGACVFGAVARLGSGEWAFVATPVGFYAGCRAALAIGHGPMPAAVAMPVVAGTVGLVLLTSGVALFRGLRLARLRRAARRAGAWNPHVATLVIGLCFVVTLLTAGAWAYTDALADFARSGMTWPTALRLLLFAALLAGAVAGGASEGRLGHRPPTAAMVARCLGGGFLMGLGSLVIPGSNDGLILLGMPLLLPYAWVAFAAMVATVALALVAARRLNASDLGHQSAVR
ncbi:MAG: YeeE/YedE family protein [Sphingomonadaceae bacterium]|nr:YeeE/YedE family protein [Sphingomonadaceae bacterium]